MGPTLFRISEVLHLPPTDIDSRRMSSASAVAS